LQSDPAWVWLGRVAFASATTLQERLREAILAGTGSDTLLVCEHPPVITLGRRARPEHVLESPAELARLGIEVHPVSRGGEATYHGPGQLVAYPVVRLRKGVLAHVEAMADAVIALLAEHGVRGEWRRAEPGVWIGEAKICAFGIHVRRGVAVHGLALNVSLPSGSFAPIVPCGKVGGQVISLHQLVDRGVRVVDNAVDKPVEKSTEAMPLTPEVLAPRLAHALSETLGLRFCQRAADDLAEFRDCKSEIVTDSMRKT
jgi:lipoate-protein ligase B